MKLICGKLIRFRYILRVTGLWVISRSLLPIQTLQPDQTQKQPLDGANSRS
jgi:hypothetical protein